MNLHIAPGRLVSEIQKEFSRCYPFLKLEFFVIRVNGHVDYSSRKVIAGNRKISDAQLKTTEGDILIQDIMKVNELEKIFRDQFTLNVQVYRRSGNLWLETTMTDGWTLQHQNRHGREITEGPSELKDMDDYDLNRDADH